MNERVEYLAERYLEGALSDVEAAEWDRLLAGDPAAARRLAELARLEAGLRAHLGVAARSIDAERALQAGRLHHKYRWFAIGSAALLALCVGAAWYVASRKSDYGVSVAGNSAREIVATKDAIYPLADGSQVRLSKGARLVQRGAESGERVRIELLEGKAAFSVVMGPGAFCVRTEVGEIKASKNEFSVELRKQDKGASEMKINTIMLVAVVAGMAEVNVGGVSYSLAGGQSRAFGEERREGDRPRGDGEKRVARPRNVSGTIDEVRDGSVTVKVQREGGIGLEVLKIGPASTVGIQSAEDETSVTDGGREIRKPKVIEAKAADLKVGERVEAQVDAEAVALKVVQMRPRAERGREANNREPNTRDGARRDGEPRPDGDARRAEPRRDGEPRKDGEARRDGDVKRDGDVRRAEPRRDGDVRKDGDKDADAEAIRNARKRAGLDGEPRRDGER